MLLCYTGASRFSGDTIGRVMRAYERGEPAIAGALDGLREVAEEMAEALRAADFAQDRRAAQRELAAAAAARPGHVHARDGAARARDARRRRARRQGRGLGRRRLDVLPRPRRSHAPRARP